MKGKDKALREIAKPDRPLKVENEGEVADFVDGRLIIPEKLSRSHAQLIWERLNQISNAVANGRAELILRIYDLYDRDGVMEITNGSPYAMVILSIAENTREVRRAFPADSFRLNHLRLLAPYSNDPPKQMEGARMTVEYDFTPIQLQAWLEGKAEEEIFFDNTLRTFVNAITKLSESETHFRQALLAVEAQKPKKQKHT